MSTDTRIDTYIEKSAAFAQPVLKHLRRLVHKACPSVEETIKWGFPHFDYNGILCNMAAFKQHCTFGFWKASIMKDPDQLLKLVGKTAMGNFNKITSLKNLPPDRVLIQYIKEAVRLNEEGVSLPSTKKTAKKEIPIPEELTTALRRSKKAKEAFDRLPPGHRHEYLEWITDAKTEGTREKRIATTIEWLAEGKTMNWKYKK